MANFRPGMVLPLVLFAGLAFAFTLDLGRPQSAREVGYLDRPLPEFTPPPMAGTAQGFSSADLSGQVLLLNVFAAWCASCRQEHPYLMDLSVTADVPIYGLNWKDAPGAGKLFLARYGDPYTATAGDSAGQIGAMLEVTGVPETFVIDAQGRLRYRHLGPISPEIWAEVLSPLIARLKEETS